MEISAQSVDDYLGSIDDDDVRSVMIELDGVIAAALPGRRRVLWQGIFWGGTEQSIIGYGSVTQPRPRGEDVNWFLIGLARQKSNYSIYVNAVEDGAYLGKRYAAQLGKVKLGSASIGFKRGDDIDREGLTSLLRRAHTITPPDPPG